MADTDPLRAFVEQRFNDDHSGIFSVSRRGKFFERPSFLDDYEDADYEFDPLSFEGLCRSIVWDMLAFRDPDLPASISTSRDSAPKQTHDLVLGLMELLATQNTAAETDRSFALAVQLGMAYQRQLLSPAEKMAHADVKKKDQVKNLSKQREKITADKACELCEQIQKTEPNLDDRSVARKAATQYKEEAGKDVSPETVRTKWHKNKVDWRRRQVAKKEAHGRLQNYLAQLMSRKSSNSGPVDDIPW